MARYQAHRDGDSSTTHIVMDSATGRAVRDPQADAPLVWDSAEDAAWYADKRNQLWTHEEITAYAS